MSLSIFLLFLTLSPSFSSFLAPITKHHVQTTPFYTIKLYLKTPLQPTDLLLDLDASFISIDCTRNYTSTTSHYVPCNSTLCHNLQFNQLNTTNCNFSTSCVISPYKNSLALVDTFALSTTDGRKAGQLGVFYEFVLACSDESSRLLQGHAKKEVTGLAGLGFSKYSLPAQVSSESSVFALCLSGSPSAPGVAFFDLEKPYYFYPEGDVSNHLNYTPIFSVPKSNINRKSYSKSSESAYFIKVKSININKNQLILNQTLLTTRISTTDPYTVLERSIYTTLIETFTNESAIMKLKSSKVVKPFNLCYEADGILETNLGPNVPQIDLVMQNGVTWKIFGKNSMVRIVEEGLDVWCLAFVDGGVKSITSMVIGGHQLEDNLLQFDLEKKRLGFSSSLLQHKTMCANFNFSTNSTIKLF